MQPALIGSAVAAGDANRLINVILKGPAAALPADRAKFSNIMPPFAALYNDAQVASLVNYVRKNFAPAATSTVTPRRSRRPARPYLSGTVVTYCIANSGPSIVSAHDRGEKPPDGVVR